MPSMSKKQHNFMAAVANNPEFAKKTGVKPSVGGEFMKADKDKKYAHGGEVDGPKWPTAGAGRGKVNPPRVKSDAEKEMMQDAQDAKDREKIKDLGFSKGGVARRGWGKARGG